jgi:DNA-directed RNA polymerase specialized sigma subunit
MTSRKPGDQSMADKVEGLHASWRKEPTPQNLSKVMDGIGPDLDRAITSAGGQPGPLTRGTARRAAVQAAQRYQPGGKAQFRTFLNSELQQLSRQMRQQRFVIDVPELSARRARELQGAAAEMESATGMYPSDAQLADKLHIPIKKIRSLMAATYPEMVTSNAEAPARNSQVISQLVQDMVYHSLPPGDQIIMQHAMGYGGSQVLSGKDVARKLKVTPATISQRLTKIQAMIQQAQEVA